MHYYFMKLTHRILTAALVLAASMQAAAQTVLTLEEAIKEALERNFSVKIVANNEEVAENNFTRGNAGFLPTVAVTAGKSFQTADTYQEPFTGTPREIDNAKTESFQSSASVSWTVFDGLRMFYAYDRLDNQREAASLATKVQMENVIALLLSNYYTIAVAQERIDVLNNTIQLSERRLEIARNKYEVGKASKVEFLAAQVDYNADKTLLAGEEQRLYQAKVNLNNMLGRSSGTEFVVNQVIDINRTLQLQELVEATRASNPSLLQSQRLLNASHLMAEEIKAERYPSLALVGSYFYNQNNSQAGFFAINQQNGYNYGLTARWNIFNGFDVTRRLQNAKIAEENASLTNESLSLDLEAAVYNAYASYQTNLGLIEIEQQNLQVAKENEEIALERYQLGNSTPLELREAQVNAVQAESRLINAAFQTKLAEIELLRLSGNLIQSYSE